MESDSDLEECGFGGVGITDEVLETWLDFPIDGEEDLDSICVFYLLLCIQINNQKVNAYLL